MKFFIILCLIIANILYAENLQDKIKSYIPKNTYQTNANFIKKIFANEKNFYDNGNLNVSKILNTLKTNGLLQLKLPKPSNVSITFRINFLALSDSNPSFIFLNYTTSNILTSMGYSYFYITESKKQQNKISTTYTLNSESNIDPTIVISNLAKRGYKVINVSTYSATHWIYDISLTKSLLPQATSIKQGDNTFTQISGKYWIALGMNGDLQISPQQNIHWYPKILIFDANMNLVDIIMPDDSQTTYKLKITDSMQYAMITDNYNPSILRSGILINLK